MRKLVIFIVVFIILAVLAVGIYYLYGYYLGQNETTATQEKEESLTLDGDKIATHLSNVGSTSGTHWQRMWEVWWETVEPREGNFDFRELDEMYKQMQENDIYQIATIKPFANWDQDKCHDNSYRTDFHGPGTIGTVKVGAPCSMDGYKNFLKQVVKRYNGDGADDMPGLTIPVKYYEIMNEPSMQGGSIGGVGEELKFFVGTSQEYLDILKASYETIKEADPEAQVLHAGMAGMQQNFQDFWDPVFEAGGGNYFDIANIHSINTDGNREDMYVVKFKSYLEKFGIKNKPIFITEAQFGELADEPEDLPAFEKLIARSTLFSLAQGADVIFYIENWLQWGELKSIKNTNEQKENVQGVEDEKESKKMFQYSPEALSSSTHKVYLNLVNFVNNYDKLEVIKEEIYQGPESDRDGSFARVAQYKISKGDEAVYVLWGSAALPSEIVGKVRVTDIYGESQLLNVSEIQLSDSPLFIQQVKL